MNAKQTICLTALHTAYILFHCALCLYVILLWIWVFYTCNAVIDVLPAYTIWASSFIRLLYHCMRSRFNDYVLAYFGSVSLLFLLIGCIISCMQTSVYIERADKDEVMCTAGTQRKHGEVTGTCVIHDKQVRHVWWWRKGSAVTSLRIHLASYSVRWQYIGRYKNIGSRKWSCPLKRGWYMLCKLIRSWICPPPSRPKWKQLSSDDYSSIFIQPASQEDSANTVLEASIHNVPGNLWTGR